MFRDIFFFYKSGNQPQKIGAGRIANFKKLKILTTSHQDSETWQGVICVTFRWKCHGAAHFAAAVQGIDMSAQYWTAVVVASTIKYDGFDTSVDIFFF